ncbi:TPA: hypothetical protein ACJOGV_002374, partial [Vibrio cholerae]
PRWHSEKNNKQLDKLHPLQLEKAPSGAFSVFSAHTCISRRTASVALLTKTACPYFFSTFINKK